MFEEISELSVEVVDSNFSETDLILAAARITRHRSESSPRLPPLIEFGKGGEPDEDSSVLDDDVPALPQPQLKSKTDAISNLLKRHGLTPEASEYTWYLTRYGPFSVDRILGFIEAMKRVDGVQPDRATYVAAAKALGKKGKNGDLALVVLRKMKEEGISPDWDAHHSVIIGWVRGGRHYRALKYLKLLLEEQQRLIQRLDGLKSKGDLEYSLTSTLDKHPLPPLPVNVINTVLSGMATAKDPASMCDLLHLLDKYELDPDTVTWNICLRSSAGLISTPKLEACIKRIKDAGLLRVDTLNTIITALFRKNRTAHALSFFERMLFGSGYPDPNIVTFTLVIDFCGKNGMVTHLSRYVDIMESKSIEDPSKPDAVKPDAPFYKVMLANYVRSGEARYAAECFKDLMLHSKRHKTFEFHRFMELHAGRAGGLKKAYQLFLKMRVQGVTPSIESYRILSFAFFEHSGVDQALAVLRSSSDIDPSEIELRRVYEALFWKVLSKGDGEGGVKVIESMVESCRSIPDMESRRELEDLLSKAGDLERLFRIQAILVGMRVQPTLSEATLLKMLNIARKSSYVNTSRSDLVGKIIAILQLDYGHRSTYAYNQVLSVNLDDSQEFIRIVRNMRRENVPFDGQTFNILIDHARRRASYHVLWAIWLKFLEAFDQLISPQSVSHEKTNSKFPDLKLTEKDLPLAKALLLQASRKVLASCFKVRQTKSALAVVSFMKERGLDLRDGASDGSQKILKKKIKWLEETSDISKRKPDNHTPHFRGQRVGVIWRELLGIEETAGDGIEGWKARKKARQAALIRD
ncbi:hypothetical protein HDU67_006395, partial [Dinochytrium kinnereticum]